MRGFIEIQLYFHLTAREQYCFINRKKYHIPTQVTTEEKMDHIAQNTTQKKIESNESAFGTKA